MRLALYYFRAYVKKWLLTVFLKFTFQKRKLDPVDEQLLKVLKAGDQNEDEWDDFGKTLAKKLRRMDAQAPGFGTAAESKIFQLLYDMESQRTQ